MQYANPNRSPNQPPDSRNDSRSPVKTIFGSATLPSGTIINLGGAGGMYLDAQQGFYAGNAVFGSAPFSVNLKGQAVISSFTLGIPPTVTGSKTVQYDGSIPALTSLISGLATLGIIVDSTIP